MSKTIPVRLDVIRTQQVGPSMRRVILGGDGFDTYWERHQALPGYTDTYVKLLFWPDDFDVPEHVDLSRIAPEHRPTMRTYTIRSVDAEAREIAIDFVVHTGIGDDGIAAPWASNTRPGDSIHVRGPNGGYAPDHTADWHLFVGDEAALPAISAAIEALTQRDRGIAFIEVDGPADQVVFDTAGDVEVRWLHRGEAPRGSTTLLDDAVRAWDWWPGRAHAFVHGESALLKSVRPYVLTDRGVDRADVSVSAYWRRGETEEGFRTWKSQQVEAVMRPTAR